MVVYACDTSERQTDERDFIHLPASLPVTLCGSSQFPFPTYLCVFLPGWAEADSEAQEASASAQ